MCEKYAFLRESEGKTNAQAVFQNDQKKEISGSKSTPYAKKTEKYFQNRDKKRKIVLTM